MDALVAPLGALVMLVAVIVVAMRERSASSGGPFSAAPRGVQWRDRAPLVVAVPLVVAAYVVVLSSSAWRWFCAGFVLIVLGVDIVAQCVSRRGDEVRVALAGRRRLRDLVPPVLLPVAVVTAIGAVGALAWVVAAGDRRGPSPCDRLADSGGVERAVPADAGVMPAATAYLWLAFVVGALVVSAVAVLVAERRPTVVRDPALDLELRRRAVARAVAVLGLVASCVLITAAVALVARYPADFQGCWSSTGFRWDPPLWATFAASAVYVVAFGVAAFSVYRFVAPSQRWRP